MKVAVPAYWKTIFHENNISVKIMSNINDEGGRGLIPWHGNPGAYPPHLGTAAQ
jgi:hypothetical protein